MDELGFASIYERYSRDVYRFAFYLSGDLAVAQDITAETFARAWAVHEQVRVGSVKAYLLMIARNLYRDGRRKPVEARLPAAVEVRDPAAGRRRQRRLETSCRSSCVGSARFPNSIAQPS